VYPIECQHRRNLSSQHSLSPFRQRTILFSLFIHAYAPRRRWVDNIRMDLQEVGCGYMDWIGLAQDRDRWRKLVSAIMNLRVP